ncbi:MAG: tRNA (adenosine(37)-N6)-threonylcarbamoyltransferase complex transferase subunit TsaD [bacterium]|nr:tRNA (adenosine(37)-N6)-threonylcarbamoyltransferase complex transferase subunit TsaD [bacterium]
MLILAIETSCDDTAIAVLKVTGAKAKPDLVVLSNTISSQVKLHSKYGGVYPTLAAREHEKNLPKVLKKSLKDAGLKSPADVDIIAVTSGPGLSVALWRGINFAKELAKKYDKPLVPTNHIEGHIYSNWLRPVAVKSKLQITYLRRGFGRQANYKKDGGQKMFPALCLIVSGGHTELTLMSGHGKYKLVGRTRDDAAGEAFDKIARILGLGYPGGPAISATAEKFKILNLKFKIPTLPRPMIYSKDYDFSFSGLKTAVLYLVKGQNEKNKTKKLSPALKTAIAAEAQQAIIDVLVYKTLKAAKEFKAKSIMLSGGVSANKLLRETLKKEAAKIKTPVSIPEMEYTTDNAAMIAMAAYQSYKLKAISYKLDDIEADANWELV